MKKFYLNKDVVISQVAGETVAVPLVNSVAQMNRVFTLNQTAAYIVGLMGEPVTIDEIAKKVTIEFDVDIDEATKDITEIINKGIEFDIFLTNS